MAEKWENEGKQQTTSAQKQPSYPISSVSNALRLLLEFKERGRLRLSDAAKLLDVATSTAHRLLAQLQAFDFIRQEPGVRTYVLGPVLMELGLSAVRNLDIREITRPILSDLAVKLDETVHLALLEGVNVRYVYSVEGERQLRVADRTGQVYLAHTSAMGRAFLADMEPAKLDDFIVQLKTKDPQLDEPKLREQLETIRQTGFAVNYRADDVTSIAMTVKDTAGRPLAAINAAGPTTRMTKQGQGYITRHMHAAAVRIEEALSAAPEA